MTYDIDALVRKDSSRHADLPLIRLILEQDPAAVAAAQLECVAPGVWFADLPADVYKTVLIHDDHTEARPHYDIWVYRNRAARRAGLTVGLEGTL